MAWFWIIIPQNKNRQLLILLLTWICQITREFICREEASVEVLLTDQFSSFMKDKGFFEYTPPGSLNLVDQIALLSRFGLVFSQYGSGAMNILFAKNNAHLVQPLCSMADGQSWDYSCAQIVGADYTYMFMPPDNPDANYFERRYTYDIEGIGNILDSIL